MYMNDNMEFKNAFDAELARWADYQKCSDAHISALEPSMQALVNNTLFCPPTYSDFISERVDSAVDDDDDMMDLHEETVSQIIEEAQGDDAVNTDSFYNETGSIPLVDLLKEAGDAGNLSTEMFLGMAKHPCMMVRGALGEQRTIKPNSLQGLDSDRLLRALRPLLESSYSIDALAAADLMLRLGADYAEVEKVWQTWEAQERMSLAFLMVDLLDSEPAYEYLGSLVGSEEVEDVAWNLRELNTSKAFAVLIAAQGQVKGDMISDYIRQVALSELPEAKGALQALTESAPAKMQQEAKNWKIRIQQRDAGVEEWLTLPSEEEASSAEADLAVEQDESTAVEQDEYPPLAGLVSPSEWSAFTDWLEEQEDECEHEEDSYAGWFSDKGLDESAIAQKVEKLYEIMGEISGTGSCPCAASSGVFLYPSSSD